MNLLLKSGAIIFLGGGGACVVPFMKFSPSAKAVPVSATVAHNPEGGTGYTSSSSNVSAGSESSTQRTVEQQTPQTQNISEVAENCLFKPDEDKSFIEPPSSSVSYFVFSCDNRGRHEEVIKSTWTIWLPETLLNDSKSSFNEGTKVNITTNSSEMTGNSDSLDYYKTTFESNILSPSSITGTWGDSIVWNDSYVSFGEEQIYKFKITDPSLESQEIYLKVKH